MGSDVGKSMKDEVESFFVGEFGKSLEEEIWNLRRGKVPWDSLRHIELINSFETRFSLQLNFEEACRLSCADDFVQILKSRSAGNDAG